MKKYFLSLICFLFCTTSSFALDIFTCEPEWESLAKEITKDKAETYSATTSLQDAHYIQAKPSLIAKVRKADLVICSGADLEVGWLPLILRKTASSKIQEGAENLIYASNYVKTIEKPQSIDRANGDVHPNGNPHLHLNPYNLIVIARVIKEKLINIDPDNESYYDNNYKEFKDKMLTKIKEWEECAKPLKNINVISNHKNMSYLFNWLKINTVATLEPKPGIPATSKHLNDLKHIVKNKKVGFIVYTPFEDEKPAKWLANETGINQILLPYTVNKDTDTKNLFDLFENSIKLMLKAKGE